MSDRQDKYPWREMPRTAMIVEWNHHLWSADTDTYPFHPWRTYTPEPSRRSTDPLAEYRDSMDERGVDRAVLVQPVPYGDDHSLVCDAASQNPDRFRATSLFHPRDPDAPQKLESLVEANGDLVVATRFHSNPHFQDSLADDGVDRLWATASELGLVVELHVTPDAAATVRPLVERYPETPVIVDHLAEPHEGDPVEYGDVLALAEFDNVYMKLSALDHFSDDGPLYESVTPFTSTVVDAFGPDRMVWGKGTPEIVDVHLSDYSSDERAKVKGGNLQKLLWE